MRGPHPGAEALIDTTTAREAAASVGDAARCANCGSPAASRFCPECGQETRLALPSVREILSDAAGRIVAWDGRTWRTLYTLLFRPGLLTAEYLRGRRRRYVRPSRLFFITALLLFGAIKLANAPLQVVSMSVPTLGTHAAATGDPPAQAADASAKDRGATLRVGVDPSLDDFAQRVDRRLPTGMREHVRRFRALPPPEQSAQIYSGVLRYGPYAMVGLLPIFALLQKLSYFDRNPRYPHRPYRYAEHLVYGAHLHAFAFLMLVALTLSRSTLVDIALATWILVYVGRARARVYGGRWWTGLLRGLPVGVIYVMLLALAMTGLVLLSITL